MKNKTSLLTFVVNTKKLISNKNRDQINADFNVIYIESNIRLLAAIVDIFYPAIGKLGGQDLEIHHFIAEMSKSMLSKREQKIFVKGLIKLQYHCIDTGGKLFENSSLIQKVRALKHFKRKSTLRLGNKLTQIIYCKSFFCILQSLAADGYNASQEQIIPSYSEMKVSSNITYSNSILYQKGWASL